jgi:hypothetical protein
LPITVDRSSARDGLLLRAAFDPAGRPVYTYRDARRACPRYRFDDLYLQNVTRKRG